MFPPGYFAQRKLLGPDGIYGKWILAQSAIIVVNDTVYMHGGPSAVLGRRSVAELDSDYAAAVQAYLTAETALADAGLIEFEDAYDRRAGLARQRLEAMPAGDAKTALAPQVASFAAADDEPAARRERTQLVSRRLALQRVCRGGRAPAIPSAGSRQARGGRAHGRKEGNGGFALRRYPYQARRRHEQGDLSTAAPRRSGLGRLGNAGRLRQPDRSAGRGACGTAVRELASRSTRTRWPRCCATARSSRPKPADRPSFACV